MKRETFTIDGIRRILVVDDELQFVKTLKRHLRRKGFTVLIAGDGQEARQAIAGSLYKEKPIQIVITDVLMPRMDGIELLSWIKRCYPEISVLAVSGFSDTANVMDMIRPEMDEYCRKPFTPDEMMAFIQRISDKRKEIIPLE